MLNKIADIEKSLGAEAYLSALALTLTLPDICGKLEFPNDKNHYSKWYDKWVNNLTQFKNGEYVKTKESQEHEALFNGEMCYGLRCAFLHSGNTTSKKIKYDEFKLQITKMRPGGSYGANSYGSSWYENPEDKTERQITTDAKIDIGGFCKRMCGAVKIFYEKHKNDYDFRDHNIELFNLDDEIKNLGIKPGKPFRLNEFVKEGKI